MTSKIKDIGISYDRFSDPKQSHGESEGRQDRAFASFCQRHQLQPSKEQFIDRGLSGFHDQHFQKGDMGRLVELAKSGAFCTKKGAPGYVLVVEAWDRLGRLRPDKAINRISELLRGGLKIGICRLDDIFTEKDFGTHKWTTLAVFVQLAYEESRQKSERVADVWQQRRKRAREQGKVMPCTLPAWLEMVNGVVRVVPERAAVIQRIFDLAIAGYGHSTIVKKLDREGVPPFGGRIVKFRRKQARTTRTWTRPYVRLILNDRRVLGAFQPMERVAEKDGEDERLVERPAGDPIKDYFPRIIEDEMFLAAQQAQENRRTYNGSHLRQRQCINVFAGLLRNAADGEGFLLHNKGKKNAQPLILVNAKGHSGRGPCVCFPYWIFEQAVLRLLREVPSSVLAPQSDGPNPADVLNARLKDAAKQVTQFKAELDKGYSADFAQLLREWRERHDAIKDELDRVLAEQSNPLANDWDKFPNLADALDNADDPLDARIRLQTVLARAIKVIHLLIVRKGANFLCYVQVDFAANNVRRFYLLWYRPKANNRKGLWAAASYRMDSRADRTDLGKPEFVPHVEEGLRSLFSMDKSGLMRLEQHFVTDDPTVTCIRHTIE